MKKHLLICNNFKCIVTGFQKHKIRIFMQMRGAGFLDVNTFGVSWMLILFGTISQPDKALIKW